jgi:hypothetical protein
MTPETRATYAAEKRALERLVRQFKTRIDELGEILKTFPGEWR